jgi:Ran GTPase-activating protein (RanGAP) involved in mRNA processing and transport
MIICNFLTQTLKKLDLGGNQIGNQGTNYLATALKTNMVKRIFYSFITLSSAFFTQTLTQLRLYKNRIRDQGAIDLASALENNKVNCILY